MQRRGRHLEAFIGRRTTRTYWRPMTGSRSRARRRSSPTGLGARPRQRGRDIRASGARKAFHHRRRTVSDHRAYLEAYLLPHCVAGAFRAPAGTNLAAIDHHSGVAADDCNAPDASATDVPLLACVQPVRDLAQAALRFADEGDLSPENRTANSWTCSSRTSGKA